MRVCGACGEGEVESKSGPFPYKTSDGKVYIVEVEDLETCPTCGEIFFSPNQFDSVFDQIQALRCEESRATSRS